MSADEIKNAALALPVHERAELLDLLMESLEPANHKAPASLSPAWVAEIRARMIALEEGRLATVPAAEAIARMRERLTRHAG